LCDPMTICIWRRAPYCCLGASRPLSNVARPPVADDVKGSIAAGGKGRMLPGLRSQPPTFQQGTIPCDYAAPFSLTSQPSLFGPTFRGPRSAASPLRRWRRARRRAQTLSPQALQEMWQQLDADIDRIEARHRAACRAAGQPIQQIELRLGKLNAVTTRTCQ